MTEQIDKLIYRHALTLRYADGFADTALERAKSMQREIIKAVRDFMDEATTRDKNALLLRNRRNERVKNLFAAISAAFAGFDTTPLIDDISDFIKRDAIAKSKIMDIDEPDISSIIYMPIMGAAAGLALNNWLEIWEGRIVSAIVAAEQNNQDLVQSLRGTPEVESKDGTFFTLENALAGLAVTLIIGASQNVIQAVNIRAKVKREMILATLDHRTCLKCAPLDGDVYPVNEGPRPPFHPRCRCVRVPYVDRLGERPYVDDERSVKDIPKSERAGKIGQTRFMYEAWFDRLSAASQKNILGPARYELWKTGKVELGDFSSGAAGKILNLDELEKAYGQW